MTGNNAKKVAVLTMTCLVVSSIFVGCGSKSSKTKGDKNYKVEDYVQLGEYTGLSADEKIKEVTDSDVQSAIDQLVSSKATYNDITDRGIKTDDTVTIDYTKSQDGKEDVSKSDYSLTVGSATLGEDFDNNLINMNVNDEKTFTIKQTSSSNDTTESTEETTVAEEENITYTVTVKTIKEKVLPEFNDEFVAANSDYKTVEEYKDGKKAELEKSNEETAIEQAKSDLIKQVVDNSTVSGVPTYIFNLNYNMIAQSYSQYATYFGMTLEKYLTSCGMSLEDLQKQAMESTIQTIVMESLLKDLNQDITDDEYETKLDEYATKYQWSSKQELEDKYSKEELLMDMRKEKALNYLFDNSTINKTTVSSDSASN